MGKVHAEVTFHALCLFHSLPGCLPLKALVIISALRGQFFTTLLKQLDCVKGECAEENFKFDNESDVYFTSAGAMRSFPATCATHSWRKTTLLAQLKLGA